ncbi:UNKNOWN [Stylonychia lemnae]|uniref:Uncharacterized protein n=1 Tax=Stylonychia lemnae TaxID=5949 RepID=A0A078AXG5_STYLE|nr:UNKNOWN [Stylonychia lemnae]|eukprot:CDW86766.1 UNKNOWN [Stylonychia lemnae]
MKANEVLKHIQAKKSLNKDDLKIILKLSDKDKQFVISKISTTRQKLILKYLEELPFLEDSFNFPLSRRESHHNHNVGISSTPDDPEKLDSQQLSQKLNMISPQLRPQVAKQPLAKMSWMQNVKKIHDNFTFSNDPIENNNNNKLGLKNTANPLNQDNLNNTNHHQLFQDESDQILALIKRIMYSEGDLLNLKDECAQFLKDAIYVLCKLFKTEIKEEELEEKLKEKIKKRNQKVINKKELKNEKFKKTEKSHDAQASTSNHANGSHSHCMNLIDMPLTQYRDIEEYHEEEDLEDLAEQAQLDEEQEIKESDFLTDIMGEMIIPLETPKKNDSIEESKLGNTNSKLNFLLEKPLQTPQLLQHKSMSEVLKELKEENPDEDEEDKPEDMIFGEELHLLDHVPQSAQNQDTGVMHAHYTISEQDKNLAEERRKERLEFQSNRITTMDQDEYLAFHQCRLANFLSRGKHLLCHWLDLNVDLFDKKDLEIFSYVLRIILGRIVEQAVRNRNQQESHQFVLKQIKTSIELEEYHLAVDQVKEQMVKRIRNRELGIEAFQVFAQENQIKDSPAKDRKKILSNIKQKWDLLANQPYSNLQLINQTTQHYGVSNSQCYQQQDFIMRVQAEGNVIEYLKSDKSREYEPINYYAKFLKDQITKQTSESKNQNTQFKVNKKFFKNMYYKVWSEMKDEDRQTYRERHHQLQMQ